MSVHILAVLTTMQSTASQGHAKFFSIFMWIQKEVSQVTRCSFEFESLILVHYCSILVNNFQLISILRNLSFFLSQSH